MTEGGDPQFRLERPGARAEDMFKGDPVMLAMVKKARAEPDPVNKPWWWIALQLALGAVFAGANMAFTMVVLHRGPIPHPVVPLAGFAGGCAVFAGLVGFRPGRFRITETDQKLTLWKPTTGAIRAAYLAGGLLFAALGPGLVMLDGSQKAAPAQHKPPHGHR